MSTPNIPPGQIANRRRSQRILFSVPVRVSGKNKNGASFAENGSTLIVNMDGGLILLKETLVAGQSVALRNERTGEEVPCTVIDINPGSQERSEVGMEFEHPNPRFWRVSFPPPDWTPRSPYAKGFVTKPGTPVAEKPVFIKK